MRLLEHNSVQNVAGGHLSEHCRRRECTRLLKKSIIIGMSCKQTTRKIIEAVEIMHNHTFHRLISKGTRILEQNVIARLATELWVAS